MEPQAGRGAEFVLSNSAQAPAGKTYLLSIGINKYTAWTPLSNAVRDAQAVSEVLQQRYGVQLWKSLFDEQATRQHIIGAFDALIREVKAPDSIIIYYAGHGHLVKGTQRGFLVPVDARNSGTDTLIRNSTLRDYFQDAQAQHILFISDACFSGSLLVERSGASEQMILSELAARPSRWVMCSGRHDETVLDGPRDGHSPFAQSLLDELTYNQKAGLSASGLAQNVQLQSKSYYNNQLSDYGPIANVGDKRGQLVLWQNGVPVAPPPTPAAPAVSSERAAAPPPPPAEASPAPVEAAAPPPAVADLATFKQLVNEALAMDEQKTALAYFDRYLKAGESLLDAVPLLQARVVRVQRNLRDGVLSSSDAEIQLNKINKSIRLLLSDVKSDTLKDEA